MWSILVPLATQTLNMLGPVKINLWLSAKKILNRSFDYRSTPLVPPGLKVLVHENPDKKYGIHMALMVGIWVRQWNITIATKLTSPKQKPSIYQDQLDFPPIQQSYLDKPRLRKYWRAQRNSLQQSRTKITRLYYRLPQNKHQR